MCNAHRHISCGYSHPRLWRSELLSICLLWSVLKVSHFFLWIVVDLVNKTKAWVSSLEFFYRCWINEVSQLTVGLAAWIVTHFSREIIRTQFFFTVLQRKYAAIRATQNAAGRSEPEYSRPPEAWRKLRRHRESDGKYTKLAVVDRLLTENCVVWSVSISFSFSFSLFPFSLRLILPRTSLRFDKIKLSAQWERLSDHHATHGVLRAFKKCCVRIQEHSESEAWAFDERSVRRCECPTYCPEKGTILNKIIKF